MTDDTLSGELRGKIHKARLGGGKWSTTVTIPELRRWLVQAEALEQALARERAQAAVVAAGGEGELYG